MTHYGYQVREVSHGSLITWEAIEDGTDRVIPLNTNGKFVVGSYPEIADHLSKVHQVNLDLTYSEDEHDKLEGQTWTFLRDGHEIVVRDIPRVVVRITGLTP